MASNIERDLGAIFSKLEAMEAHALAADASFAALAAKLDASLRTQESQQRDIGAMKPVVEEFSRWRLIGLGAVLGVGAIGTLFGIGLATARDAIIRIFGWAG